MYTNLKSLNYTNWSITCRFCLSSESLVPIFQTGGLATKINETLKENVYLQDHLPDKICCQCVNKIETTRNAINNIIQSTIKIRDYVHFLKVDFIDIDDSALKSPRLGLVIMEANNWENLKCLCYYNWYKICRFCFSLQNLYDLYSTMEIVSKVEHLTGLMISDSQKLPNKICCECRNQINSAYEFVSDCCIATKKLRKYLELIDVKSYDSEEEEEEKFDLARIKLKSEDHPYCDETCGCVPKTKHGESKH